MNNDNEGYYYVIFNSVFTNYGENVYKLGYTKNINEEMLKIKDMYVKNSEIKFLSQRCNNIKLANKIINNRLLNYKFENSNIFYNYELNNIISIISNTIDIINNNRITYNNLIEYNIINAN